MMIAGTLVLRVVDSIQTDYKDRVEFGWWMTNVKINKRQYQEFATITNQLQELKDYIRTNKCNCDLSKIDNK